MEIGNKPRILYQALKQIALAESAKTADNSSNPVDRMEFADQLTLHVTEPFSATIPERYSVGGISGKEISVRPESLMDNNPATNDSITIKTEDGFYQISERHDHKYEYITTKWNDEQQRWLYQRDGLLADT